MYSASLRLGFNVDENLTVSDSWVAVNFFLNGQLLTRWICICTPLNIWGLLKFISEIPT